MKSGTLINLGNQNNAFLKYLCLNSWKSILLGKPCRQILIPSNTPLHRSWSRTRWALILPALKERKYEIIKFKKNVSVSGKENATSTNMRGS